MSRRLRNEKSPNRFGPLVKDGEPLSYFTKREMQERLDQLCADYSTRMTKDELYEVMHNRLQEIEAEGGSGGKCRGRNIEPNREVSSFRSSVIRKRLAELSGQVPPAEWDRKQLVEELESYIGNQSHASGNGGLLGSKLGMGVGSGVVALPNSSSSLSVAQSILPGQRV